MHAETVNVMFCLVYNDTVCRNHDLSKFNPAITMICYKSKVIIMYTYRYNASCVSGALVIVIHIVGMCLSVITTTFLIYH